jgi:hypothetical protein
LVIDYARHTDEQFAATQADVWLGFESSELLSLSREVSLSDARVFPIPQSYAAPAADGHVGWQLLVATKSGK